MKTTRPATSLLFATVALGFGNVALADTFHGWRYSPPKGYTAEQFDDHVALTKTDGDKFCSLSLFGPRRTHSPQQEVALDWHGFVENTFTHVKVVARGSMQTSHGIDATVTRAIVDHDGGTRLGAIQYGLAPHGLVASMFVLADSPRSLPRCAPAAKQFLDSLSVDWSSPDVRDPEARTETVTGRWATSGMTSVRLPGGHRLTGIARSEYTFFIDGTYRYQSTQLGEPETQRTVVERGTYSSAGYELTLAPISATTTLEVHGHAKATTSWRLPQRTYLWDKSYQVETNRWSLELTPKGKNLREGERAMSTMIFPDANAEGFPTM